MTQTARRGALLIPLLFLLLVAGAPLALAASWVDQDDWTVTVVTPVSTDLTVTPGASGAWVTGGYNFSKTASATSTGFKPLHGVERFTVVVWITVTGSLTPGMVFSQRVDANNKVNFYVYSDNVVFSLASPPAAFIVTITDSVQDGNKSMLVMTWDQDLNSGKLTAYVYDANTGNTKSGTSGSAHTGTISANAQLYLGGQDATTDLFNGTIWSAAIYTEKFDTDDITVLAAAGSEASYGAWSNYWPINEAAGVTFHDSPAGVWNHQDYWDGVSAVTNTPSYPQWNLQDNYTTYVEGYVAPVVPIDPYTDAADAWILLIGVVCFIAGPCLPAASIRASGWSQEKLWLILMGLLIWSFGYSLLFSF